MRSLVLLLSFAFAQVCAVDDPAPGASRGLPCDGAPAFTYDLFLPKAYAQQTDGRFPVLFIAMPGGNPGFMKLESWAERQGVVLVAINQAKDEAAKSVAATVLAKLRLHHCLRFGASHGGGAWATTLLAGTYGDDWAGLLICNNGRRGALTIRKHVACAYATGTEDSSFPLANVHADYESAKSTGNPVRIEEFPGQVRPLPIDAQERLLDWMLELARLTHPRLSPEEQKAAQARLRQQITDLDADADPLQRAGVAERFLAIEAIARTKDGVALKALWCSAMVAQANAEADPVRKNRLLETVLVSERATAMPPAERKALQAEQAKLKTDKAVKADSDSRMALAQVAAAEAKSNGAKAKTQGLIAEYRTIATRWPDTEAGRAALAAAERLQGK